MLKCEKSFKRDHMKKHYTLTNENEGIPCKKCKKTFLNVPKLNQHIRNVHSEKTCLPCDEPFSSAAYLDSRQIMHFNETPFACAICEKTFKQKQHLRSHQDIHNVGKQYPCPKWIVQISNNPSKSSEKSEIELKYSNANTVKRNP